MAGARRFEDLIVWQLAVRIRNRIYVLTDDESVSRDFKFCNQIRDSSASAPRNIAEGFFRFNPAEFAYFLNVAKSSLGETQNHLLHGKERKYFNDKDFTDLWRLTCRALKAANRLHEYLRTQPKQKPRQQRTAAEPKEPDEPKEPKEPSTLQNPVEPGRTQ